MLSAEIVIVQRVSLLFTLHFFVLYVVRSTRTPPIEVENRRSGL